MFSHVIIDGIRWDLYDVNYTHRGKEFTVYLYAPSRDEAVRMIESLRKSAELGADQIVGITDHEPTEAEMMALCKPAIH